MVNKVNAALRMQICNTFLVDLVLINGLSINVNRNPVFGHVQTDCFASPEIKADGQDQKVLETSYWDAVSARIVDVLIILMDDSEFGQWGTFGGQIPTPSLDRVAKMGLRYRRFHTTALCSPTLNKH